MDLRLVSDPLTREQKLAVCSVESAKAQARVTHADEDELIGDFIETAYDFLSGPTGWLGGCCLLQEEWEAYLPSTAGPGVEVPLRPLAGAALSAFDLVQPNGAYAAVAATQFTLRPSETFARIGRGPGLWPYLGQFHPQAYRIRFTAGFATPDEPEGVPRPIVQSIKMLVGHWYKNRETVGKDVGDEVLYGLRALAGRYRVSPDHS